MFQPLTQEQYQSARTAGFSHDQIVSNEQIRKQQSDKGIIGNIVSDIAKPFAQTGVTALNLGAGIGSLFKGGGAQGFQREISASRNIPYLGQTAPVAQDFLRTGKDLGGAIEQAAGTGAQIGSMIAPVGEIGGIAKAARTFGTIGAVAGAGQSMSNNEGLTDVVKNAAIGGAGGVVLGAGTELAGKTAKYLLGTGKEGGLPERLYNTIFKTTDDEELARMYAIAKGQEAPKTLSRKALEEGLKGSPLDMGVVSAQKLNQYESQLQDAVSGKSVQLKNKAGFLQAIKDITGAFKANSYGTKPEVLAEANNLFKELNFVKGETVPADTALRLKRFLDGARLNSSFNLDAKLSPKQAGLKELANLARNTVKEQIPQARELLGQQQAHINFLEALSKKAASSGNKELLNLTDALIGGTGLAFKPVPAFGMETAYRASQAPEFRTGLAQGLFKTGKAVQKITPPAVRRFGRKVEQTAVTQLPRVFGSSQSQ